MTIVGDVIDRLIDLVRRREEVDRALYEDAVAAMMTEVDALHVHYLQAFRRYRDSLIEKQQLDASFLDTVGQDSLFSRDLRARVRAFADTNGDTRLRPLMRAVHAYLELATVNPLEDWREVAFVAMNDPRTADDEELQAVPSDRTDAELGYQLRAMQDLTGRNVPRSHLINGAHRLLHEGLAPELTVRLGLRMLESILAEVQRRYAVITRANAAIRTELLEPK